MITADQLLCHFVGDYILQSDWMANEKTKQNLAAAAHAVTYSLPFLFLRPSWAALVVIAGTHYLIDRYRLARYVVWLKNFIAPFPLRWKRENVHMWSGPLRLESAVSPPWRECVATGYPPDRPAWLSVWLLIIADNTLHVAINGAALLWL